MHWKAAAIICLGLVALPASAQVHRCQDVTGKTVYSDRPCDAGQKGQQIERQRTQEEIAQERRQAYKAEAIKRQRNVAQDDRDRLDQRNRQAAAYQQAPSATAQANDWQSRKDRENAATSSRSITSNGGQWDSQAEAERLAEEKRRKAARPPTMITHCVPGVCYDDKGGVYHQSGQDVLIGPGGRTCFRSGNLWNCN